MRGRGRRKEEAVLTGLLSLDQSLQTTARSASLPGSRENSLQRWAPGSWVCQQIGSGSSLASGHGYYCFGRAKLPLVALG